MQDVIHDDSNILNENHNKILMQMISTDSTVLSSSPGIESLPTLIAANVHKQSSFNASNEIVTPSMTSGQITDDSQSYYNCSLLHTPHDASSFGSTKLLLRNFEDPLISKGVSHDDENSSDLKTIIATSEKSMAKSSFPSTSDFITDCTAEKSSLKLRKKSKKIKTRQCLGHSVTNQPTKKGTVKLKFHHNALPAEYSDKYEMTLKQLNSKETNVNKTFSSSNKVNYRTVVDQRPSKTEKRVNAHETIRNWLEKISEAQNNNVCADDKIEESNSVNETRNHAHQNVTRYSDLPYMGEITLNNSKPKRGRKPKKADICNLIYKNYGTIIPGTPKSKMNTGTKDKKKCSLLEKCLSGIIETQKNKFGVCNVDKPLNLCLRDQSNFFHGSCEDNDSDNLVTHSTRTSQTTTQNSAVTDAILGTNFIMYPNLQSNFDCLSPDTLTQLEDDCDKISSSKYSNLTDDGAFLKSMALYYKKIPHSPKTSTKELTDLLSETKIKGSSPELKSTKDYLLNLNSEFVTKEKHDYVDSRETPSPTKTISSALSTHKPSSQKRKRSAIFIPPMPTEKPTNPATEVNICKFKFTGGPQPSLQKKKMLSVDSDGNYRYYSGTGDKSMRGYEFFPRETLQQSGVVPGVNCSNAFLNAVNGKSHREIPLQKTDNKPFHKIPDPTLSLDDIVFTNSSHITSAVPKPSLKSSHNQHQCNHPMTISERNQRKSTRSVLRERLEKTFKEKGFLIQTQQYESAEGLTYCKFRQLRKFTRYLFRSWKDYLPGEIKEANVAVVAAAAAAVTNQHPSPFCSFIEATSGNVDIPIPVPFRSSPPTLTTD